jgi:hypothetical protein
MKTSDADRRRDADAVFEDLVASDPAMRRYVVAFAERARDLRGFALGLYAEAMVADALDADLSAGGTDDVDIRWSHQGTNETISIQVRSCRAVAGKTRLLGSVSIQAPRKHRSADELPRRKLGAVWVFALHSGEDHRDGWRFHVRLADDLDEEFGRRRSVAIDRLAPLDEWITTTELPAAVTALL